MTLTEFDEKQFAENRRKEGYDEGFSKGFDDGVIDTIKKMLSKGMTQKQIADILEIPMERVDSVKTELFKH